VRVGSANRGFTLIETIVVVGLLTTLLLGYSYYRDASQTQSLALDFQAASLQSAQMLVTHLMRDFDNIVPSPLEVTFTEPTPRTGVAFHRITEGAGILGQPLDSEYVPITEKIEYVFDEKDHRVYRNGQPIRSALFESVDFTFFPVRPQDPANPPYGDTLIVRMVVVPVEAIEKPKEDTPRSEFIIQFHSPQGTSNHVFEHWIGDH